MSQIQLVFTQEAPTYTQGVELEIKVGKEYLFRKQVTGRHRKWIRISNKNTDAGDDLSIVNPTGEDPDGINGPTRWGIILAGTTAQLDTSDDIRVRNNVSNDITIRVMECFYLGAGNLVTV